jgi:hypothetical protein
MITGNRSATGNDPIATPMIPTTKIGPGKTSPARHYHRQQRYPINIQFHGLPSLQFPATRLVTHTPLNEGFSIQAICSAFALL